jgi:hypothetical protein
MSSSDKQGNRKFSNSNLNGVLQSKSQPGGAGGGRLGSGLLVLSAKVGVARMAGAWGRAGSRGVRRIGICRDQRLQVAMQAPAPRHEASGCRPHQPLQPVLPAPARCAHVAAAAPQDHHGWIKAGSAQACQPPLQEEGVRGRTDVGRSGGGAGWWGAVGSGRSGAAAVASHGPHHAATATYPTAGAPGQ